MKGIREPVGIAAPIGSALHDVRYWFLRNSEEISTVLDSFDSIHSAYDYLKEKYNEVAKWAIDRQKQRIERSGQTFDQTDLIYLEDSVYGDAAREAATSAMNLRFRKQYGLNNQTPKLLLLEGSDTKPIIATKEIDGAIVNVSAHQDIAYWIPINGVWCAYDYKTGKPVPLDVGIESYHFAQLNGYSWVIETAGLGKCPIGAINFTQVLGIFSLRPVLLNPMLFENLLHVLVGWHRGKLPDFSKCSRKDRCFEAKRIACKETFGW
jgi:hypothetical protein